ncbi:hypothetical protein QM870_03895 [Streptococcus parasanguinis]|uniref:hypothetical protein n=1 Tax=Streptococcus parasanguinis TaxID=1318 RepID=UPI001D4DABEB|nr:hypothetical protein [Streptococcus parasanguinis]
MVRGKSRAGFGEGEKQNKNEEIIFKANFYESRRLRHDGFIDYMVREANRRSIYTKFFSLTRIIFSSLGALMMFGFSIFIESLMKDPNPDAPVETWGINFYPLWLFFLCWFLWFIACKINLWKKYPANLSYITTLNANLYIFWMVLAYNLFFISILGKFLTVIGLILFYLLTLIILFFVIRVRIMSIKTRLYGVQDSSMTIRQRKLIDFVTLVGGGIVAGWMILKLCFPRIGEIRTDFWGTLSIIGISFVFNVIMIGALFVLFLPHSLYGYYRNKYSEEYREFEGKSLEEWYGKQYLNKHRELLEDKNEEINL